MSCPFLSRLPSAMVRNYGAPLVKKYGDACPMLKRHVAAKSDSSAILPSAAVASKSATDGCPFLKNSASDSLVKKADLKLAEDVKAENGKEDEILLQLIFS